MTNIGSGFEISIGDTAKLIADTMGARIDIECDEQRLRPDASEVERLFAGTAKAEKLMRWRPAFGGRDGFRRGLEETIAWFRDPQNLRRYKIDGYQL